jgi:hypothetical protein
MRRSQIAWALLGLAVGSTGALAAKLDKTACNDLNAELAGVVGAGARADMERGPAWAMANLPPERLANIRRLIELEEQLEFRCGIGHNRVATSPGIEARSKRPDDKRSDDKVGAPEGPVKKPPVKSNAASPPTKPVPDALRPSPQKAASKTAPSAIPVTKLAPEALPTALPSASPTKATSPAGKTVSAAIEDAGPAVGPPLPAAPAAQAVSAAIGGAGPEIGPPLTMAPAAKAAPATAARTGPVGSPPQAAAPQAAPPAAKSSRRASSAAYLSPTDVNPFFVTGYGDRR